MRYAACRVLLKLVTLPLVRSTASGHRMAALLRELHANAQSALDVIASAAPLPDTAAAAAEAAELAWLVGSCVSLGCQAAIRLGQLGDAVKLSQSLGSVAAQSLRAPVLLVLHATLLFQFACCSNGA